MWEIFSGGKTPYKGVHARPLTRMLENGVRLDKPNTPACSEAMYVRWILILIYCTCVYSYKIMMDCWERQPGDRPTFGDLHTQVEDTLAGMDGYKSKDIHDTYL